MSLSRNHHVSFGVALLLVFLASAGCTRDEKVTDPHTWEFSVRVDMELDMGLDLSGTPDISEPVDALDLSRASDLAATMDLARPVDQDQDEGSVEPVDPLFPRPSCAPANSGVDGRLRGAWEDMGDEDRLIVLASADWAPGETYDAQNPYPEAMVREIEEAGFTLHFKPGDLGMRDQSYGSCRSGEFCWLAMVELTKQELQAWLATSCEVRFVILTGFDCVGEPDECDRVASCRFVRSGFIDPLSGMVTETPAGCHPDEPQSCNFGVLHVRDETGACWRFHTSCFPERFWTTDEDPDCKDAWRSF